ncbi:pilin [Photobacterium rosenbergii]|uniref:pilin n=1 Tax=Photobacterium rosenbergii TaxID=294936 RepID=UPI001C998C89|nr:pilin [Photobacterium rosenbergii]MBY5947577.1 pilin [Photobacterium rosenbergii]
MKKQQGFTLIELMIVVAVIGLLSAIAVPKYQEFAKKGAVASGMATLSALKTNIEDYMASNGSFPPSLEVAGAVSSSIGTIGIGDNTTTFTFNTGAANGSIVTFTRKNDGAWTCSHDIQNLEVTGCDAPTGTGNQS